MRRRVLSRVVGAVIVSGAWLTGACGSSFISAPSESGGSGGEVARAGRGSGGALNGGGGAHAGKAGSGSGGVGGADAGAAGTIEIEGGAAGTDAGGTAGAPPHAGSAGLNHGGRGGTGAGGAGAGGAGAGGAGAGGAGAGGGGTGGAGAGAGGAVACLASAMTWTGCQPLACGACSSAVTSYPLYFKNHPSCTRLESCPNALSACGAACPAPSSADLCDGTLGQWNGCRGTGCYVCAELVTDYPKYFQHHPGCVKNETCAGVFATCNANCPAPVEADK